MEKRQEKGRVREIKFGIRLNKEEKELLGTGMELCGYKQRSVFARDVLCGFAMRAIARYTTPKVVGEVLSQSDNEQKTNNI